MNILIQALYFMLPAYCANMAPVLFKWLPFADYPLDLGFSWCGKRIFGENKTLRGLIFGIIMAIAVVFIQRKFETYTEEISILKLSSYSFEKTVLIGFLFGAGALLGDAVKSFFKRRLEIPPGKPWILFDQLDFVIGSLFFVSIFYLPPLQHLLVIFIATPILHFLANIIGYSLHLKNEFLI